MLLVLVIDSDVWALYFHWVPSQRYFYAAL